MKNLSIIASCLTLENLSPKEENIERELTFYLELSDLSELTKADRWETQEQWELKLFESNEAGKSSGTMRVRKTSSISAPRFELTIKTPRADGDRNELNVAVGEDMFEHVRAIATRGMTKKRYFFNIPDSNLVWEMDVFQLSEGQYANWVKLDLEHTGGEFKTPEFPVKFSNMIAQGSTDPEDKVLLQELYDKIFMTKK